MLLFWLIAIYVCDLNVIEKINKLKKYKTEPVKNTSIP